MNKKLYNLMDWAAIEEVVYAECVHPENILGATNTGNNTLIQCFYPGAKTVELAVKKGSKTEMLKMEEADEAGFFAVLVSGKNVTDYEYHVLYEGKKKPVVYQEVYNFESQISEKQIEKFINGTELDLQSVLGSKIVKIGNNTGAYFSVYAPNAMRVSVVGDFNDYNGLVHQMIKNDDTGIFEIFIPGVKKGAKYQYEILIKGADKLRKIDPYAKQFENIDGTIYSVIDKAAAFKWSDTSYKKMGKDSALRIYEICQDLYSDKTSLADIAGEVCSHMSAYGYTHVQLFPLFQYFNESLGFIPSALFGMNKDTNDIKKFINIMHEHGYGVIVQLPFSSFDEGASSFGYYDGSCLYEHEDYRKGIDPRTGARIYQYGNLYVKNMLLAAANYIVKELHVDGIKLCDLSSMLYLDYYRNSEWVPNELGTNENLEAIEFIKQLNALMHKNNVFTIAEAVDGWSGITDTENGLGFNYVINNDFNNKVIQYLQLDPIERKNNHELLIQALSAGKHDSIISVSHSDIDFGKGGIIAKLFGDTNMQSSEYKLFITLLITVSKNISLFMGQDEADRFGFDGVKLLNNELSDDQNNIVLYIKDIIDFIITSDLSDISMVHSDKAEENVIVFMADNNKVKYLFAINFANCNYDKFLVSVPLAGKYKEILNSDKSIYGGNEFGNEKMLSSKDNIVNEDEQIIKINMAALSCHIFEYIPYTKSELDLIKERNILRKNMLVEKQQRKQQMIDEKNKIKKDLLKEAVKKVKAANNKVNKL